MPDCVPAGSVYAPFVALSTLPLTMMVGSSAGWCVALLSTWTVRAPAVLGVCAMLAVQRGEANSAEIAARERSFVDGRDIEEGSVYRSFDVKYTTELRRGKMTK